MKILFDTNVILDVLIDRAPFVELAAKLFSCVEKGTLQGYLCASSVTTLYYLSAKVIGQLQAQKAVEKLLSLFEIAPVNRIVLSDALLSKMADYEDAVIDKAAFHAKCQAIVTRNTKDFKHATMAIYSPAELVALSHED